MIGYRYRHLQLRSYLHSPQKEPQVYLVLTLFSLIIIGGFAVRPSLAIVARRSQENEKALAASAILKTKIAKLAEAQTNYQKLEEDMTLVKKSLPEDPEVHEIITRLAEVGGDSRVTIRQTVFEKTFRDTDIGVEVTPFTVKIEGTLASVASFVSELEESGRQIDFAKVEIQEENLVGGFVVANVRLKAYSFQKRK